MIHCLSIIFDKQVGRLIDYIPAHLSDLGKVGSVYRMKGYARWDLR